MAECIICGSFTKFEGGRCYPCYQIFKANNVFTANEPSEGELFLAEYFASEGISAKEQEAIHGLKNDTKSFRKADFYLPNYNLFIEFFGQWNVSEDHKARYKEKRRVYLDNQIPCVFLYPENLGIIDFLFPKRAIAQFQKYDLKKELFLFRLKFLWLYKDGNIVLFFFLFFVIALGDFKWKEDSGLMIGIVAILTYQIYSIFKFYNKKLK